MMLLIRSNLVRVLGEEGSPSALWSVLLDLTKSPIRRSPKKSMSPQFSIPWAEHPDTTFTDHLPVSDSSLTSVASPNVAAFGPSQGRYWKSQMQVTHLCLPLFLNVPWITALQSAHIDWTLAVSQTLSLGAQTDGGGRPSRASLNVIVGEMSAGAPAPGDRWVGLKSSAGAEHSVKSRHLPEAAFWLNRFTLWIVLFFCINNPDTAPEEKKADTQDVFA